ncbi:RDD family protein [Agrococcus carbonis]|uniref:Uncharacterized membrane protein YckC, RDD family n=1 Tax=Agrococcus carbonis TaxID=684552 RepID=A0A1H1P6A1_9MICO|nr:RDD family protein [Agrococcus carbonis]SDS06724.1 Uncharacterized membrane protein YckC, RDD family [Agrococcus carbonis]
MSEQPAGWYPDPFAAEPGASRFWDGERWTTQVQSPLPYAQPSPGASGHGHDARGWGVPAQPAGGQPGRPGGHPEGMPWSRPDRSGELASWGARVGAYLIDIVPVIVVTMVMLWMTGVYDAVNAAIESGDEAAVDAAMAMMATGHPAGLAITAVNLLFVAVYNIGFHVSRGATPGKMIVGIRVRMADEDRNPDLRAAGVRWLVQFGPNLISGVPVIGFLAGIFSIVDHLWPVWDAQKQAIHDKAGRTVVVRSR